MKVSMKRTSFLNDAAHTALSGWTDEEIEDAIESFCNPFFNKHFPHLFYYPADDMIDACEHFLAHGTYEEDKYYDEYYSIDIFLKEHNLKMTVENVRLAAEEIADGEDGFFEALEDNGIEYDPYEWGWTPVIR